MQRPLLENSKTVTWQIKHYNRVRRRLQHLNSRRYFKTVAVLSLPRNGFPSSYTLFKYFEVLGTI